MATPTSIATAIAGVVDDLAIVDYASVSDFMPAVQTASVAALVVPFGQKSTGQIVPTMGNTYVEMVHIFPVEFWVKHAQGTVSTTTQRARDICALAIAELLGNDGAGYDLAPGEQFAESIDSTFIDVGGQPYLVATLEVPCRNEVTAA